MGTRKLRRPSPAMVVAVAALVVALGGSAVAAVKLDSSPPLKVCVAAKEGKPVVTPKEGVCKRNYTLTEANKEGPEGKEGQQGPPGESGVYEVELATPLTTKPARVPHADAWKLASRDIHTDRKCNARTIRRRGRI